jgi:hypothetical protein
MCALFEEGQWPEAAGQAKWVQRHSSADDWRVAEMYLTAAQIEAVVAFKAGAEETVIEAVLQLWEVADERFGATAPCEIHERPWQIDRYCREKLSSSTKERLDALLSA